MIGKYGEGTAVWMTYPRYGGRPQGPTVGVVLGPVWDPLH